MTTLDRLLLALTACALWGLLLGDFLASPPAQAEAARAPDRYMSEILHEIVVQARAGQAARVVDGYDELEARLEAVLSRAVPEASRESGGISSQELRAVLASCRLFGTVTGRGGRLDARLTC